MPEQPDRRDQPAAEPASPDRPADAADRRPDANDRRPDASDRRPDASDRRSNAPDRASEDESAEDDPSLAGIFGARSEEAPPRPEIRPESPSAENAAFVALGVLLALLLLYRVVTILPA